MNIEIRDVVREAFEVQVLDADPGGAARLLEHGARTHGIAEVSGVILDSTAVLLRRMVSQTDEAYDSTDLLERLALDGAVPEDKIGLLSVTLGFAAATAGGIRPSLEGLSGQIDDADLIFGAWLAALAALKIVAITLDTTEAELVEDLRSVLEVF